MALLQEAIVFWGLLLRLGRQAKSRRIKTSKMRFCQLALRRYLGAACRSLRRVREVQRVTVTQGNVELIVGSLKTIDVRKKMHALLLHFTPASRAKRELVFPVAMKTHLCKHGLLLLFSAHTCARSRPADGNMSIC